jgi:hypothetical protein
MVGFGVAAGTFGPRVWHPVNVRVCTAKATLRTVRQMQHVQGQPPPVQVLRSTPLIMPCPGGC